MPSAPRPSTYAITSNSLARQASRIARQIVRRFDPLEMIAGVMPGRTQQERKRENPRCASSSARDHARAATRRVCGVMTPGHRSPADRVTSARLVASTASGSLIDGLPECCTIARAVRSGADRAIGIADAVEHDVMRRQVHRTADSLRRRSCINGRRVRSKNGCVTMLPPCAARINSTSSGGVDCRSTARNRDQRFDERELMMLECRIVVAVAAIQQREREMQIRILGLHAQAGEIHRFGRGEFAVFDSALPMIHVGHRFVRMFDERLWCRARARRRARRARAAANRDSSARRSAPDRARAARRYARFASSLRAISSRQHARANSSRDVVRMLLRAARRSRQRVARRRRPARVTRIAIVARLGCRTNAAPAASDSIDSSSAPEGAGITRRASGRPTNVKNGSRSPEKNAIMSPTIALQLSSVRW